MLTVTRFEPRLGPSGDRVEFRRVWYNHWLLLEGRMGSKEERPVHAWMRRPSSDATVQSWYLPSALATSVFGVVDLARDPRKKGSLARPTTSDPNFKAARALDLRNMAESLRAFGGLLDSREEQL